MVWTPLLVMRMKLNFNGSTMMGNIAVGGVFHNSMGKLVVAYTNYNYGGGSKNKAKTLALLWGMKIAKARGITRLAIKGYPLFIINDVKGLR